MPTMAQAVKAFLRSSGKAVTADEIKRSIHAEYPNQWKPSTLQAHLYACTVNNPKAYVHHPSVEKFMYKTADGSFELYSEERHGANEWAPAAGDDEIAAVEELAETTVSLERDIEDHLVNSLESIEPGLQFRGRQVPTDVGRVDILAEDANGARVIIEVKVSEAKDSSVGQIARYIGWYARVDGRSPRGILVASEFPEGIRYAATAIPSLTLLAYKVHFSFQRAEVSADLRSDSD